ncbi:Membrane carboxypeptidase MrcB, partial [Candidatus Arthromitus sp. SFB-3]
MKLFRIILIIKAVKNKKIITTFLIFLLAIFLIGAITVFGFTFAIIKTSPPLTIEAVTDLDQASQLFDADGEFMDEVLKAEKRYVISLDEMPLQLRNAFIAIEDERFYQHSGIDIQRIISAVITDIKKILNKQSGLHGASTLTQQVIKNNILTNEVSVVRKIREIYLALELEKQMSKDQILEIYLNTIFVGGNAYGVEAGALQYFSKNAKDLTLAQSAFLAGSTQHPTKYYS